MDATLPWLLDALRRNGIEDVVVVGGKDIDVLSARYPAVQFRFNPHWATSGMVGSLLVGTADVDGPVLVTYCDTVYRPEAVGVVLDAAAHGLVVAIDRQWQVRYLDRSDALQRKAEKVEVAPDGTVRRIARDLPGAEAHGEFTGLLYLAPPQTAAVRQLADLGGGAALGVAGADRTADLTIIDLLQALIDRGDRVHAVDIGNAWADLDSPQDLTRFVFGTKAETLERLQPVLQTARVLDQVTVDAREWAEEPAAAYARIREAFPQGQIVVRSSAPDEDALDSSNAGVYHSVLGVAVVDQPAVAAAVDAVLDSYGDTRADHRVLVQPWLDDAVLSGVAVSCDLRTGGPYYVLTHERSSRTDGVTSGSATDLETVALWKHTRESPGAPELARVVAAVQEVEARTGSETVDVEYAVRASGEVVLFQARPLAITEVVSRYYLNDVTPLVEANRAFVEAQLGPRPPLGGDRTILGDMPDWNPAEMLGAHPRPLAHTLYADLITNHTWRDARAALGYFHPEGEPLMLLVGGHPYIDVRNSLNSLTPAALAPDVRDRIVTAYLDALEAEPAAHDKLEFEIAVTCTTPDFDRHAGRLREHGVVDGDIAALRAALLPLTNRMLQGEGPTVAGLLEQVDRLTARRAQHHALGETVPLSAMQRMLEDARTCGTLPFSMLARMAFVGSALLRGLAAEGLLTPRQLDSVHQHIPTVASDLMAALTGVRESRTSLDSFLEMYGHLRPGTYDILSPRYDAAPDRYFPAAASPTAQAPAQAPADAGDLLGEFSEGERGAMTQALEACGLCASADAVLRFVAATVAAREAAKFRFTVNLSAALECIARWGETVGLTRDDLSFLSYGTLLRLSREAASPARVDAARAEIAAAREQYRLEQMLIMPGLITAARDLEIVEQIHSRPNFITTRRVLAPPAVLEGDAAAGDLSGKIVLLSFADPGFDWIFTRDIAGLITQYGGANSHMAIRSAEFGLPAAIGCGAALYADLRRASAIELDCGNRTVAGV